RPASVAKTVRSRTVSSYSAEPVSPCTVGFATMRAAAQRAVVGRSSESTAPPSSPSAMTTMATKTTMSGGRGTAAARYHRRARLSLVAARLSFVARCGKVCPAMRSGDHYLASLDDGRAVFLDGERVADVTKHPAFAEPIRRIAHTWDLARAPEAETTTTYVDPATGRPHGTMWLAPPPAA